jgi:hypothetical protein
MKLNNDSQRVQHVETLNGAVLVSPGDYVEVNRDEIMQYEFDRIAKTFIIEDEEAEKIVEKKKERKKKKDKVVNELVVEELQENSMIDNFDKEVI